MTKIGDMRNNNPLISIVILNWNGNEDTIKCVESVNKLTYKNIEIVVIDNGSRQPITAKELASPFPLKVVQNPRNRGFAGGEVSALPHCNGEYLFLLNNDALIDKNAITNALKTFDTDETIAVVGGKSYSLFDDGNTSLGFHSFQYIDPVTADVKTYGSDDGVQDAITVSGSAVMIKRSAIDRYGYFDERFFAYYEETDLFARYQRAGLRVVYDPKVIILHKDGAATRDHRFMYYYLMLKNQFLFAYKNFDTSAKKNFLKTYFRNFRRSLWVYVKDRSKTEGIHKARVRSTLWNILHIIGTTQARYRNLAINPDFNYTDALYTRQPLGISLIIDATKKTDEAQLEKVLQNIIAAKVCPSEIIVVTNMPVKLPKHSPFITIKNVVDKKIADITPFDFGFMTSNTNVLSFASLDALSSSALDLSEDLIAIYEAVTRDESAVVVQDFKGSDLTLTNGGKSNLVAIKKNDLVDFMFMNKEIYSITDDVIGEFINWIVVECKPIARLHTVPKSLVIATTTPISNQYPILQNPLKWKLKKLLRRLHLSRIINKVKKALKKPADTESTPVATVEALPPLPVPSKKAALDTPIFFNTRDLFQPLAELVAWLEKNNHQKIIFVDNDSSYPELMNLFASTKYQVLQLGRNGMHRSPWESFAVRFFAKDKPYVVTDPDIIPTNENPADIILHLYKVLHKFPEYKKVGVALKIDDIPDHYSMKQHVLDWEARYWDQPLGDDVYIADTDTTFALYRENTEWFLSPSLRVGGSYAMRHEPWYQDLDNPTDDMMYYRARASNEVTTWVKGKLPKHHLRALKKEGFLK
jgi:GT2 family glycosyltransferase